MQTIKKLEEFLYSLPSTKAVIFKDKAGLDRARKLYAALSNPQDDYKSIHVAGTSGKGSVCLIISALLKAHGFKVGTHLSPHVQDIRERMLLNLNYPTDSQIERALSRVEKAVLANNATYFEASVVMAFEIFKNQSVDYAVIETGLGGRVDATNCINRSDKIAVIGRLGLDHTRILGSTIEEIAAQKAGIIHPKNYVVALRPDKTTAQEVLAKQAKDKQARLDFINTPKKVNASTNGIEYYSDVLEQTLKLPSLGLRQAENTELALRSFLYLAQRDGFRADSQTIVDTLAHLNIPGRGTLKNIASHPIVFDGAHNPQKINNLLETIKQAFSQEPIWVFGCRKDKDISGMLQSVACYCSQIVFTPFISKQATAQVPFKTASLVQLQQTWQKITDLKSYTAELPADALNTALAVAKPGQPIVICGSLYLVGELLRKIETFTTV